jgi:hypothetical protein
MKVVVLLGLFFLSSFVFTQIDAHIDFIKSTNTKTYIHPSNITNDKEGNLYITGSFGDSAIFDGTAYFNKGGGDLYLAKYSPIGDIIWVRTAGGLKFDATFDVVTNDNKVFISGSFIDSINFASDSTWNGLTLYSDGLIDFFISCYSLNGDFLWAKRFGATNDMDNRKFLIATNENNLFVGVNMFELDSINFNTPIEWNNNSVYKNNFDSKLAIVKYSFDGVLEEIKEYGNQYFFHLTDLFANNEDMYMIGVFLDTLRFNENELSNAILISRWGMDYFLTKHSLSGELKWARRGGGADDDIGSKIAIYNNEIYTAGLGSGLINFSTPYQIGVNEMQCPNFTRSIIVAKYDSNGNFLWSNMATSENNYIRGISGFEANNTGVYITGVFEIGMSFGLDAINNQHWNIFSQGFEDMFLFKVGKEGEIQWSKRGGGWAGDYSKGITLVNNKIYNTGVYNYEANFNTPAAWGSNEIIANSFGISFGAYLIAYYESAVGLEENVNNGLLVYPNPSEHEFNIESQNELDEIKIYNVDGICVFQDKLFGFKQQITPNLSSGVYIVKFKTINNNMLTHKIILR